METLHRDRLYLLSLFGIYREHYESDNISNIHICSFRLHCGSVHHKIQRIFQSLSTAAGEFGIVFATAISLVPH